MSERILQIIVFVVKELHSNDKLTESHIKSLHKLGYTDVEISTALSWLVDREITSTEEETQSFRMLNEMEKDLFTTEALGDLLQYQALGLISNDQIDFIIDRILTSEFESKIDRNVLGYIVMALVFKSPWENILPSKILLNGNETIH
ncbi:MAG: DUF494 domain-containing protein [Ignavibacteria bacterium]|nr:DUF494 domain-containing protein [Ignavibacteria bacterium]